MKRIFEGFLYAAVLAMFIIVFIVVLEAVKREPNPFVNYYPETGVVVECDEKHDAVIVRSSIGVMLQFYGIRDYQTGDIVSMIMDDMDTPGSFWDDLIIDVQYAGTAADFTVRDS